MLEAKIGDIIIITDRSYYTSRVSNGDIIRLEPSTDTRHTVVFKFIPIKTSEVYGTLLQTPVLNSYRISIYHRMKFLIEKHKQLDLC